MIKSLQSIRFIAILGVFLSHLMFLQETSYKNFYERYLYGGFCGVTFFIVLSGFVIAYNYYNSFDEIEKKVSINFIKKRLIKLYPVHILTLIIALPFAIKSIINSPLNEIGKIVTNIFLLQSFIPNETVYFSYNAVSWYLSCSILFYILTPYLLNYIKKINNKSNFLKYGVLIYIIIFSIVVIFKDNANAKYLFYICPFFRIFDYILGLLCGVYIKSIKNINNNTNKNNTLLYTLLEILTLVSFIIIYYFYPYVHPSLLYGVYYLPIMIALILIFSQNKGFISKIISNKLLVYLGGISFEFYMIHQLVIRYLQKILGSNHIFALIWGSLILSIILSILINMYIKKILLWLKQLYIH